jgi:hypothetical protein
MLVLDVDRRWSSCRLVIYVLHHCLHQLRLHSHELFHGHMGWWWWWIHGGTSTMAPTSASASSGGHLLSKAHK